jgi:hypothetical protein
MKNDETARKKGIARWPLVITLVLALLVAGGYYAYQRYITGNRWKPYLQAELKALVLKTTDSLYHIEYSDFDLNITTGSATLKDFKLVPDTAVYNKLVALKKAPDNLFTLSVKKLSISNLGAVKAYKEKILNISSIMIDNPDLTVVAKRLKFNDTVKVGKPKSPYEIIKSTFKQLHIDSIALKDISLNYINKNGPVEKHTALKHLNINISDVVIDSLSDKDTSRFYYTKGIDIRVEDYHIATPDSLYKAAIKEIYFSTSKRLIYLDGVSFLPRYSKTDFYLKTHEAAGDIYNLKFNRIAIYDVDLQRFLRDQMLYAGTLNIKDGNVQIYSNNAYKGVKSSKIGKDPEQSLQNVALDMQIRRVNIKNTLISYAESDATSGYTGVISFTHTNATILNVTNDDDIKKVSPYMIARVNTRFMDAGDLNVNFKFNLGSKIGAFNYNGKLGQFDGRKLDKLVKPLALVHVQSADIQKLHFNVDASNYAGKGQLEFYYKNLNVQLLKKVEGKAELQTQGFISKLANTLIIDDDNPDKKGIFRPGPIDVKRESTVSFFSFLYKALLDGLKPSVGFDKKTEGNVNKAIVKVNNIVDKFKAFEANRKAKKQARQEARAAKKAAKMQQDSLNKK